MIPWSQTMLVGAGLAVVASRFIPRSGRTVIALKIVAACFIALALLFKFHP